jgi:hypothetical protein
MDALFVRCKLSTSDKPPRWLQCLNHGLGGDIRGGQVNKLYAKYYELLL